MSRVGKKPIIIPQGIKAVLKDDDMIEISGQAGTLTQRIHPNIKMSVTDGRITFEPLVNDKFTSSLHGLSRSLVNNMIEGISKGFKKELLVVGLGYRMEVKEKQLILNLGFTHPVVFPIPDGIQIKVEKDRLTVSGIDKQLVGETAVEIRRLRPPEPYKGKGIKYADEVVRRKAGKAAVTGGGPGGGAAGGTK